jgi:hypothetical protein
LLPVFVASKTKSHLLVNSSDCDRFDRQTDIIHSVVVNSVNCTHAPASNLEVKELIVSLADIPQVPDLKRNQPQNHNIGKYLCILQDFHANRNLQTSVITGLDAADLAYYQISSML